MTSRRSRGTGRPIFSEKQFQHTIIDFAQAIGYRVYHQIDTGACQACQAPNYSKRIGPGFPDLVIAGRGKLIYAEVKSETGKLSVDQEMWRDLLLEAGAQWYLWRPSSWTEIEKALA